MSAEIENYINGKLAELDRQKDLQDTIGKGRFSFGIDSTTYGHLPGWAELVRRKKQLVRIIWANAIFLSFMVVVVLSDFTGKFAQSWWKATISLLAMAAVVLLFYVIGSFYSVFVQFRQTERLVRKLIYQDILHQLKKEKELV